MAFTLGFFGSIHCIGMCGPLAMGVSRNGGRSFRKSLFYALVYNLGRISTYALLGALFGLIGEAVFVSGFQKTLSILAGILLITLFLSSMDLEKLLFKSSIYKRIFTSISNFISWAFKNGAQRYPFFVGMLNGVLPCGLVYLALAGSLTAGNVILGSVFMSFFGLGTFPAMIGVIVLGFKLDTMAKTKKALLNKAFPILHLGLGIFLIYRGILVDIPSQLDFWVAIKDPVMCH
ncbi:MAG: sulfite exporter TauE/SafE family protein [Saprospiraceae bacterium]